MTNTTTSQFPRSKRLNRLALATSAAVGVSLTAMAQDASADTITEQHPQAQQVRQQPNAPVQVTSLNTDKAAYQPDATAKITIGLHNTSDQAAAGKYTLTAAQPYTDTTTVIQSGDWALPANAASQVTADWQVPADNYKGYTLHAEVIDTTHQTTYDKTSALDVSTDWTKFPRYSAVTNFGPYTQTADDNVQADVATLAKYHVNASLYYDAYFRPQNPEPSAQYRTWLGADVATNLVQETIQAQHDHGQKALLYNMINATTGTPQSQDANLGDRPEFRTVTKQDGTQAVESDCGIFRNEKFVTSAEQNANTFDAAGEQATYNMLGSVNDRDDVDHKVQSYYDPANPKWQNYIGPLMRQTVDKMGFDGWHGDTVGQIYGTRYADRGHDDRSINTVDGYGVFTDNIKQAHFTGKYFGMNAVGGQGQRHLDKSKADFQYTEIWPNHDMDDNAAPGNAVGHHVTYADLGRVVDNTAQNSGQSLIVPAYLYHGWARSGAQLPPQFNDNAVLLKEAAVFANGGDSLSLADNGRQLFTEFYPDGREHPEFRMSQQLGDPDSGRLRQVYDFVTAYQNILRDNDLQKNSNQLEIWQGGAVGQGRNLASHGQPDHIWAFSKSNPTTSQHSLETINLINLVGVTNVNWQIDRPDDEQAKNGLQTQRDLAVKYYPDAGRQIGTVYVTSPDPAYQSQKKALAFTKHTDADGKTYITFQVPRLDVWNLIYLTSTTKEQPVQPVQPNQPEPHSGGKGGEPLPVQPQPTAPTPSEQPTGGDNQTIIVFPTPKPWSANVGIDDRKLDRWTATEATGPTSTTVATTAPAVASERALATPRPALPKPSRQPAPKATPKTAPQTAPSATAPTATATGSTALWWLGGVAAGLTVVAGAALGLYRFLKK